VNIVANYEGFCELQKR